MADRYLLESSLVDGYLLEDGTGVLLLDVGVAITETIIAKEFPMLYRAEPVKTKELRSRVSGATITKVANTFPHELLKNGKAKDLRSKWS